MSVKFHHTSKSIIIRCEYHIKCISLSTTWMIYLWLVGIYPLDNIEYALLMHVCHVDFSLATGEPSHEGTMVCDSLFTDKSVSQVSELLVLGDDTRRVGWLTTQWNYITVRGVQIFQVWYTLRTKFVKGAIKYIAFYKASILLLYSRCYTHSLALVVWWHQAPLPVHMNTLIG